MADKPIDREAARKAALAAQVASWKEKEAARLEKRRRDRLTVNGDGKLGSSRGSSPGIANTRSVRSQIGSYKGSPPTQDQYSGSQEPSGAVLFRPEEIRHLPGPFSETERNDLVLNLDAKWKLMSTHETGTPEYRAARQRIEEVSQGLQTRIRDSYKVLKHEGQSAQQIQQIQQIKQNPGFNARAMSTFNTRTAVQASSLPPSSNDGFRPTYYGRDKLWEYTRRPRESRKSYRGLGEGRPSRGEVSPVADEEIRIRQRDGIEEPERPHSRARSLAEVVIHPLSHASRSSSRSDATSISFEDHRDPNKGYTSFPRTRVDVVATTAMPYRYDIDVSVNSNHILQGKENIAIRKHLEQDQINEISKLSFQFATMREVPAHERSGGGLRIENSTISRDNVVGKEARQAELLALYGKKQFTLAFRSLNHGEEMELVDREDQPRIIENKMRDAFLGLEVKPVLGGKFRTRGHSDASQGVEQDTNAEISYFDRLENSW